MSSMMRDIVGDDDDATMVPRQQTAGCRRRMRTARQHQPPTTTMRMSSMRRPQQSRVLLMMMMGVAASTLLLLLLMIGSASATTASLPTTNEHGRRGNRDKHQPPPRRGARAWRGLQEEEEDQHHRQLDYYGYYDDEYPAAPLKKKRMKRRSKTRMKSYMSKNRKSMSRMMSGKGGKGYYYLDDYYWTGAEDDWKEEEESQEDDGYGKGKGKGGGGGGGYDACKSSTAYLITAVVPEVTTYNPRRCCHDALQGHKRPTAVYVTHAQPSDTTITGLEQFWNDMYLAIAATSAMFDTCFVLTGYDASVASSRSLSEVMTETLNVVSRLPEIPVIMTTDPTDDVNLIGTIRRISEDTVNMPNIGVFNAGYNNLVVESLVSGKGRLPFVGSTDDTTYGETAAAISLELLNGVPPRPVCFNARMGELDFIGERCAAYYAAMSSRTPPPNNAPTGVACSSNTTAQQILDVVNANNSTAIWTHIDCCAAVGDAVAMLRHQNNATHTRVVVSGCQDEDLSDGQVDFVTTQPIQLQGYQASSWSNFPIRQAMGGNDGRQYFPSLESLVETAVYNVRV